MRKLLLAAALGLGVVVYLCSTHYGIKLGPLSLALEPDKHAVEIATRRFLEDVKFKDFAHASTFHTEEDRKRKDIAKLIEEKFQIKPELLDIRDFDVLRVEVASTGQRAKALTKVFVKLLNSNQDVKEVDLSFFFKKQDGAWFMDLQSSL